MAPGRDLEDRKLYRGPELGLASGVADWLVQFRLGQRMSQQDLSRKLKTVQSAVSRIEGGLVNPTWNTLIRLASISGARFVVSIDKDGTEVEVLQETKEESADGIQYEAEKGGGDS